jgi:nitrite reductase (NO-forming)
MEIKFILLFLLLVAFVLGGCVTQPPDSDRLSEPVAAAASLPVEFTLKTGIVDGKMAFVGVGGEIDGLANPDLPAPAGAELSIKLLNGDGMPHDLVIQELAVQSTLLTAPDQSTEVRFQALEPGTYAYFCSVSGHRQAGMEGRLIISDEE